MTAEGSQWTLAYQGAESRIKFGVFNEKPAVLKERFVKKYRHPDLDRQLTKRRQKAEIGAINKLRSKCPELALVMPEVLSTSEREIIMTRVENAQTSCQFIANALASNSDIDWLFKDIGRVVGTIHKHELIHGDLTTSNILINDKNQLVPIDFGLAQHSKSCEDRAVDLYVLERALQSTHVDSAKFDFVLEQYKSEMGDHAGDKVIKQLDAVRLRGRKRLMIG